MNSGRIAIVLKKYNVILSTITLVLYACYLWWLIGIFKTQEKLPGTEIFPIAVGLLLLIRLGRIIGRAIIEKIK